MVNNVMLDVYAVRTGAAYNNDHSVDASNLRSLSVLQVVDFAVAKFTVTEQRDAVIDYTYPFWQEPSGMIMRRPQRDYLTVYIGPFQADVWLALGLSLPLVGLALAAIVYVESTVVVGPESVNATRTVLEAMWVVFHMYFQQGASQLGVTGRQ